jgi:hypothetical protein
MLKPEEFLSLKTAFNDPSLNFNLSDLDSSLEWSMDQFVETLIALNKAAYNKRYPYDKTVLDVSEYLSFCQIEAINNAYTFTTRCKKDYAILARAIQYLQYQLSELEQENDSNFVKDNLYLITKRILDHYRELYSDSLLDPYFWGIDHDKETKNMNLKKVIYSYSSYVTNYDKNGNKYSLVIVFKDNILFSVYYNWHFARIRDQYNELKPVGSSSYFVDQVVTQRKIREMITSFCIEKSIPLYK